MDSSAKKQGVVACTDKHAEKLTVHAKKIQGGR
jgi:hypothetical protein